MTGIHIWKHKSQPGFIHYSLPRHDGTRRRLYQLIDSPLGRELQIEWQWRRDRRMHEK